MSTLFYVLLILAPAAILATAYAIIKKRNQGRSIKRSVAVNLATFAVLTVLIAALSVSVFAAGLVTGLAGIGGGIAVAAGAPAAIAATAEDPKSFGKSIIFVALGESIALYGVVISILILQKV